MLDHVRRNIIMRCMAFVLTVSLSFPMAYAQQMPVLSLPAAGEKVGLSLAFSPDILSALTVYPQNPFQFDFYLKQSVGAIHESPLQLIKDFLAALTTPEDQLWVNLSPYEKDRMINESFGRTDMGRDLLAQDYLLKQITASLLYPEGEVGKRFWGEVYKKAYDKFGTTDIPVDSFNKVWIMPETAEVYQDGTSALVTKSKLKVMLETDYVAASYVMSGDPAGRPYNDASGRMGERRGDPLGRPNDISKNVMRQIIIPILEKEVNEGQNFARLRQIYNALILATWYKKVMRESFLGKVYVDRAKMAGIEQPDITDNQKIYAQYVEAFRKGVVNFIKEENDPFTGELIPRKYLSGGFNVKQLQQKLGVIRQLPDSAQKAVSAEFMRLHVNVDSAQARKRDEDKKAAPDGVGNGARTKNNVSVSTTKRYGSLKGLEEIKSIVQQIKAIQPNPYRNIYGSQGKEVTKLKELLIRKIKEDFRAFIGDMNMSREIIKVFNLVIDDKNETGLKSLILSGKHTETVYKYFWALSLMSQQGQEIPYDAIVDVFNPRDGVKEKLINIISGLRNTDELSQFYDHIRQISYLQKNAKSGIFLKDNIDETLPLIVQRKKDPEFSSKLLLSVKGKEAWVKTMLETGQRLLLVAYDNLHQVVLFSKLLSKSEQPLVFVRLKDKASLMLKLTQRDMTEEIYDLVGGRIVVRDLADIEKVVVSMLKFSQRYEAFQKAMLLREGHLNAKAMLASSDEQKKSIEAKREALREVWENFQVEYPVLVRFTNYFMPSEKAPSWYRQAIHGLFMLRDKQHTVEMQVKTYSATILHDIEHKIGYKSTQEKESPLLDSLIRLIWVMNIVEGVNYFFDKNSEETLQVLDMFQKSNGKLDGAQLNGGIDIRYVLDRLHIKEGAVFSSADFKSGAMTMDDFQGFSPHIISIEPVNGLPFIRINSLKN